VYQRTTGHKFIPLRIYQMPSRFSTRMSGNSTSIATRRDGQSDFTVRARSSERRHCRISATIRPGLYVGRTLLPPNHRDLKVCVADTTNKAQVVPAGSYLGQAVPVTVISDVEVDSKLSASNSDGPTVSDKSLS